MKTDTPSELEGHLGFWLRFVSNHVSSRFAKLLEAHEISVTEWVSLRTLYQRSDATHAELIDALGMTKGATSKVISKLESKSLAERQQAIDSARAQTLRLTRKGNQLVPVLANLADENDAHFFGYLSEAQRTDLEHLMKELVNHHQLTEVPVN